MRIDDRKVNGRIVFEQGDIIRTWTIFVGPEGGMWIAGFDEHGEPVRIPNSVAGAAILEALMEPPILFTVMNPYGEQKILPFPSYSINIDNTKLSIDIGEIMAGKALEIALPSGAITMKDAN